MYVRTYVCMCRCACVHVCVFNCKITTYICGCVEYETPQKMAILTTIFRLTEISIMKEYVNANVYSIASDTSV